MRHLLFVLFIMMAAMPAFADAMEQTERPVITFSESQDFYSICVTGDGLLSVTVYSSDGETMDSCVCEWEYNYDISRSDVEYGEITIVATAQQDGKLVSDVVTLTEQVHGYIPMPDPVVSFIAEDDGLNIDVEGGYLMDIMIMIDGNLINETIAQDHFVYYICRTYEDQFVEVIATAIPEESYGYGYYSVTVERNFVYEAMEMPYADMPVIIVEEEETRYVVYAEGHETVHLLLDGNEVDNPYYIPRGEEAQIFVFEAYCEAPNMQNSPTIVQTVYVEPLPLIPYVPTAPPVFNLENNEGDGTMIVFICPTEENCVLYYRIGTYESNEFVFGEWMASSEEVQQLMFSNPGTYCVEAYARAEGKAASEIYGVEFVVFAAPTPLYDFEEDGIFYIITSDDKLSVCSETTGYNTYSGEVTIPARVTHNGVTYMVTGISENAFRDCFDLTGVTIGAYVTAIGNNAFYHCSSLTSVTLGDYVISVGEKAFAYCSVLADVKMGCGIRNIGSKAFQGCDAMTSVTCKAATPPVMAAGDCFACYGTATLHVYPAVLDSYQASNYWGQFATIVAEDNVAPVAGDTNGDGNLTISDVTTLINMLLNRN